MIGAPRDLTVTLAGIIRTPDAVGRRRPLSGMMVIAA
ncbi:hypothetical protein SAMN06295920_11096 [Rhizorhabdus histidinilytica]|uniref:Uncharacterized protein n=1 Tax=Rhizorhabdus histidinilytica TaxID=439228 RepID=A0A1T5FNW8_9SPHN|nr:hypothetical protein SAMN06295920_11096 [Rhizorhabdus histidinilytica]